MSKNIIENQLDIKKLNKFMKEIIGRGNAFKRFVVHQIAREARKSIYKMAPQGDELVGDYARHLKIYLNLEKGIRYGVLYSGKEEDAKDQDSSTTVLYVRPLKRKQGRWSKIVRILNKYGPFTMDTLPVLVDKRMAKVVYRKVSEQEVDRVYEQNKRDMDKLAKELALFGVKVDKSKILSKEFDVVSDMAFRVIRKEFGIGVKKVPHWRPGLRKTKSKGIIDGILNDVRSVSSLIRADYGGWKKLGMIKRRITKADIKKTEEFQKKIIGD